MFHVKHETDTHRLVRLAAEVGATLTEPGVRILLDYLDWLLATNSTLNLTAPVSRSDALRIHIVDSLSAVKELKSAPFGTFVDIGTGGGLPGVPLSLATGRSAVLLDSVGKKARALASYLDSQSIDARSLPMRSEELAAESPGEFSAAVVRAVAPLATLVELASPLLCQGGHLICMKGRPDEAEVLAGEAAAEIVGLRKLSVRELRLPDGGERRMVFDYQKVAESQVKLPRRPGRARSHPLA